MNANLKEKFYAPKKNNTLRNLMINIEIVHCILWQQIKCDILPQFNMAMT